MLFEDDQYQARSFSELQIFCDSSSLYGLKISRQAIVSTFRRASIPLLYATNSREEEWTKPILTSTLLYTMFTYSIRTMFCHI
jgi:hypothetical protein